ncbi:hypothetical protein ACWCPS_30965 [Streptomyces mauvecolor]
MTIDESDHQQLTTLVAGARAACALPLALDERHPLFHVALPGVGGAGRSPDADGLRLPWVSQ